MTTRIGIVGGGIRGQLFARSITALPDVEVTGIADPSERARTACADAGHPVFDTIDPLLEQSDGLIIATPDFAHFEATSSGIDAGIPMLVEKPLTTDVAEARELHDRATEKGVDVFVGFENRWANAFKQVKQAIDAGQMGAIRSGFARLSDRKYVPTEMLSWASRSSAAWFLMPHTVDLLAWFIDSKVESVSAQGVAGVVDNPDTIDGAFAVLKFANGAIGCVEANWFLPNGFPAMVDFKVDLVGEEGAVNIDNTKQMLALYGDRTEYPRTLGSTAAGRPHGPAVWMAQSFARRLQGFDESLPTSAEGVHITEVIDAVHRSINAGGQSITL